MSAILPCWPTAPKRGVIALAITPILEHDAPGLLALVTRDIFRGGIGGMSGAFEELRNDQF